MNALRRLDPSRDELLLGGALALHGPLDVALTATHFQLESNPIVIAMGIDQWIIAKAAVLAAVVGVFLIVGEHRFRAYWLACLVVFGVAVVAANILAVTGVIA